MSDVDEKSVVNAVVSYKRESDLARRDRMTKNARNFDFYHLKQDFSHKKTGQSQEFLPKVAMAVEQTTSFVHQGLIDLGEWFSVEPEPGNRQPLVSRDEARLILSRQLSKANFFTFIEDSLKSGLLGAVMIAKVHGRTVEKPVFFTEKTDDGVVTLRRKKNQVWQLKCDLIRQQDYFPDPTGEGLYEIHSIEMDLFALKRLAEANPDVYDLPAVEALVASQTEEAQTKDRETDQSPTDSSYRKRVRIDECWGTLIGPDGDVLHENVVCAVANDSFLIRKPQPNPNWHGKSPFVVAPLMRVPHSVWHKALMDAPTALNQASNEIYNLVLDAGINSVFGVRQVREDWIENADELSNGISPGFVAKANSACPPGQKVIETVSTGAIDLNQGLQVLNITNAELQAAALSNDLRQGVLPSRSVKATEVVEASQSITSVFTGIAKSIETSYIEKLLDLAWLTIWQNADDWDADELESLLGEKRAQAVKAMSAQERFAKTVGTHSFKVFGITQTINKIKDYRKQTALLQTVGSSPVLMEEFSKKYDLGKLLGEIVKALDVNEDKIKLDESDDLMGQLAEGGGEAAAGSPVQGLPDQQSQIPQMANLSPESSLSAIPTTQFSGRAFNGG
ncbi:MAG TPA: hypothetical protein VMZ26_13445 [Pyrinomonadaceae bacterium]|nr:hypothetical protein [Pyrinomonadaceae bacterium]